MNKVNKRNSNEEQRQGIYSEEDQNPEENEVDESLCGSSLDFEDAEDEESDQEEIECEELRSFDKVPAAINAQKFIDDSKLKPEMRKHFNKISYEYDIDEEGKEFKFREVNSTSPVKHMPGNTNSQQKIVR